MASTTTSSNKRNASDSSNLLDMISENPCKKQLIEETELPTDMPAWAKFLVDKMNQLNVNNKFVNNQVIKMVSEIKSEKEESKQLKAELTVLKLKNARLEADNTQLHESLLHLETYQCRDNMIFSGISEDHNEKVDECQAKLKYILNGVSNLSGKEIKIGHCHRLGSYYPGKIRPIITHIPELEDHQSILENRKDFPWGVYISEDFPKEIQDCHKEIMPIFKLACSLDKYKDQTKLCSDKLIIGRSTYQVKPKSNLNTLPPDLNPAIAAK